MKPTKDWSLNVRIFSIHCRFPPQSSKTKVWETVYLHKTHTPVHSYIHQQELELFCGFILLPTSCLVISLTHTKVIFKKLWIISLSGSFNIVNVGANVQMYILWAKFKTVLYLGTDLLTTMCVTVNYSNVYILINCDIDFYT